MNPVAATALFVAGVTVTVSGVESLIMRGAGVAVAVGILWRYVVRPLVEAFRLIRRVADEFEDDPDTKQPRPGSARAQLLTLTDEVSRVKEDAAVKRDLAESNARTLDELRRQVADQTVNLAALADLKSVLLAVEATERRQTGR